MANNRMLLAVLIDADNVSASNAEAILEEIASLGEPALRRVYGDWSSEGLNGWTKKIPELGLVARQETANTKQKNASDIGLVIDAMDILHSGKFDGFVIVSSDSDFTALANRLREDGLTVFGIGERKTPQSLRNVCNRFIFIDNITDAETATDDGLPDPTDLVRSAIEQGTSESDWHDLAYIGSAINAAHSDFDTRSYGHSKLSKLIKSLPGVETKQTETTLLVRLKP